MPPRTIDNLGVDIYTRYAEDQKAFDKSLIEENKQVYPQAAIDVTKPAYSSQFSLVFGLSLLHPSWASFQAPKGFGEQKNILFTNQLLPFLGNEDKQQAQIQRVKQRPKQHKEQEEHGKHSWQDEKEEHEEEKEKETLLTLFSCIGNIDKDIIEVNTRRKQFQKG
jgi:hypothetical protein